MAGWGYIWPGFERGFRLGMDITDRDRGQAREDEIWRRQDLEWRQGQEDRARGLQLDREDRQIARE